MCGIRKEKTDSETPMLLTSKTGGWHQKVLACVGEGLGDKDGEIMKKPCGWDEAIRRSGLAAGRFWLHMDRHPSWKKVEDNGVQGEPGEEPNVRRAGKKSSILGRFEFCR